MVTGLHRMRRSSSFFREQSEGLSGCVERLRLCSTQESENDPAGLVVVHRPAYEGLIGALNPAGALYEKPVSLRRTASHHGNLVQALESFGVRVCSVSEALMSADKDRLVEWASQSLRYQVVEDLSEFSDAERMRFSDNYKFEALSALSKEELVQVLIMRPTVELRRAEKNTPLITSTTMLRPVNNLLFCRDQQITTAKGVVLGCLNPPQRAGEVELMKHVWETLGVNIVGHLPQPTQEEQDCAERKEVEPGVDEPPKVEGGDFFPVCRDLALLGVGLRSSASGGKWLMKNDMLGTRRFGIVRDEHDQNQDRMHLDCVFNIADEKRVVMLDTIIGEDSPTHRVVDVYIADDTIQGEAVGAYRLARKGVEFSQFLREEGFQIIPISEREQLEYMINFLNLGCRGDMGKGTGRKGVIISVHPALGEKLIKAGYEGSVHYVPFEGVTSMYGAAHCCTQVFRFPVQ